MIGCGFNRKPFTGYVSGIPQIQEILLSDEQVMEQATPANLR